MVKLENHHLTIFSKTSDLGRKYQLLLKLVGKMLMDIICAYHHYFCFSSVKTRSSKAFPCLLEVRHSHVICFSQ